MDDDELTTCPSCDATFQVIIDAGNPANVPLSRGGYRDGWFCPMCGAELEDQSEEESED